MQNNEILALPCECWRWFPGYEDIAQVSTRGQVQTVDRWVIYPDGSKRFRKGRILKQTLNKKTGYLIVKLSRDGKQRTFAVHRMVAETWISNPENKPEINHIDEDKTNNDVYNLEWCNRKYNINYGTGNKRRIASRLKPVQGISPETGLVVREFPSVREAGRNGFTPIAISRCCRGIKCRRHRGLEWRFKKC